MAAVYKQACLVVCRAGATSLAELAAIGLPAILVPYPYAADNHQEVNARYFEQAGAARLVLDKDCTAEKLKAEILAILPHCAEMSKNMQALGVKDAVRQICKYLL